MIRDNGKDPEDAKFFARYRRHTGTVIRIDSTGNMTLRDAVERGHLRQISEGVYRRPKGNE